jgi:hypothetical protein
MALNPKREAVICHKIAALAYLMAEALDELNPEMSDKSSLKSRCNDMSDSCQEIVNNMFGVPEIKSTVYLQELSNKVDTCIRKNYVRIPGTKE